MYSHHEWRYCSESYTRIEEQKPGADRTLVVKDLSTIGASRLCLRGMDDEEDYNRVFVQVKLVKVYM